MSKFYLASFALFSCCFALADEWRLYQSVIDWNDGNPKESAEPTSHIATFDAPLSKTYKLLLGSDDLIKIKDPQLDHCQQVKAAMETAYPAVNFGCFKTDRTGDR